MRIGYPYFLLYALSYYFCFVIIDLAQSIRISHSQSRFLLVSVSYPGFLPASSSSCHAQPWDRTLHLSLRLLDFLVFFDFPPFIFIPNSICLLLLLSYKQHRIPRMPHVPFSEDARPKPADDRAAMSECPIPVVVCTVLYDAPVRCRVDASR